MFIITARDGCVMSANRFRIAPVRQNNVNENLNEKKTTQKPLHAQISFI